MAKKPTRKQKYEAEKNALIFRFVSDMKDLADKHYPKGGIPVD